MIRPLLLDTSAHTGNSDEVNAVYSSRLLTPQSWRHLHKLGGVARWREITVFKHLGTERATLRRLCKRLRTAAEPVSKPRKHLPRKMNMHEKVPADMTTADFTSAAKRESHSVNCPRFAVKIWFVPHGSLDLNNHPMHFG